MFSIIFQSSPLPPDQLFGLYDMRLVVLSYLVATFASFIALDITGRIRDVGNSEFVSNAWLVGGSLAMGTGIWSMHFIGMLAFSMPGMSMTYDPFWTAVSLIVAILASAFAFFLLKPKEINLTHFIIGGILLGLAIASMHYIGMYAMTNNMNIHYLPGLFTLSIIIAIVASEAALWLAIKSNQAVMSMRFRLKCISALIMGAAICGMHYTGMAAAVFTPLACSANASANSLDPQLLSIGIAIASFCLLTIAVLASTYKEAKNQQLLATARQAGMAEVAASVLHNVGNVLNSVNVSAALIAEKINESKINELDKLSKLLNSHKHDIADFMAKDPAGTQLPKYINMLSEQWKNEQAALNIETNTLIKNIDHIKYIIGLQQNLSRICNPEQIIDVEELIEEALLIAGLNANFKDIKIEKNYQKIKSISIDKIKLLQILVNLINNAKDSLLASNNPNKILTIGIMTAENDTLLNILFTDNGIGIPASQITHIFSYGFTTKKNGHGFGLHSCALAAKEMGGGIRVYSEGEDKGATFTLELPYKIPRN